MLHSVTQIVEILFTQGRLSCLFTTETFAMGVNAPAKSVCFTQINKHDGSAFRTLVLTCTTV